MWGRKFWYKCIYPDEADSKTLQKFGTTLPDNRAITSLTNRKQNIRSYTETYKLLYETF